MFLRGLEDVLYTGEPCLICDPFVLARFPFSPSFKAALSRIWFGSSTIPTHKPGFFFKLPSYVFFVQSILHSHGYGVPYHAQAECLKETSTSFLSAALHRSYSNHTNRIYFV